MVKSMLRRGTRMIPLISMDSSTGVQVEVDDINGNKANLNEEKTGVPQEAEDKNTNVKMDVGCKTTIKDKVKQESTRILRQRPNTRKFNNENTDADLEVVDTEIKNKKCRGPSSHVWKYCDILSTNLVNCTLCRRKMKFHGTANLITHLERKHNIHILKRKDKKCIEDNSADKPRTRKNGGSIIWKYCVKHSPRSIECNVCKKVFSFRGTSNIQRHLQRMHNVCNLLNTDNDNNIPVPAKQIASIDNNCLTTSYPNVFKCQLCNLMLHPKHDMKLEMRDHLVLKHGMVLNTPGAEFSPNDSLQENLINKLVNECTSMLDDHIEREQVESHNNEIEVEFVSNVNRDEIDNHDQYDKGSINEQFSTDLVDKIIMENQIATGQANNSETLIFDEGELDEMFLDNALSPQLSSADESDLLAVPTIQSAVCVRELNKELSREKSIEIEQSHQFIANNPPLSNSSLVKKDCGMRSSLPVLDTPRMRELTEQLLREQANYFNEKAAFYRAHTLYTQLKTKKESNELQMCKSKLNESCTL